MYVATGSRVVFGSDDLDGLRAALEGAAQVAAAPSLHRVKRVSANSRPTVRVTGGSTPHMISQLPRSTGEAQ